MSARVVDDKCVGALIEQGWESSGCVCDYREGCNDLDDIGEPCGKHRVARMMPPAELRSHTGQAHRPGRDGGRPAVEAPNPLAHRFTEGEPNGVWVTGIFHVPTDEG